MKTKKTEKFSNLESVEKKLEIISEIGRRGNKSDIEDLISLIEDSNGGVREAVKEILIENPGANIIKKLIPFLENIKPEVRNLAVELLYEIVDADLESIGSLVYNQNENIAIFGCQILGYSKKSRAIEYLKDALVCENANIRNSAASSLEIIKSAFDPAFLLERLKDEKELWVKFSILEVLHKKGPGSNTEVLNYLIKNEDNIIIAEILKVYGKYGDSSTLEFLISKASISSKKVRKHFDKCIINIINRIDSLPNTLNLEAILKYAIDIINKSTDVWCKYEAIGIIGRSGDKNCVNTFKKTIKDDNPLVRIATIKVIASFKNSETANLLIACLDDADKEVKKAAEKALGMK